MLHPQSFAYGRAGSGSHGAFSDRFIRRVRRRALAHLTRRTSGAFSDSEVIQDGRRNQRDSRGASVEADSFMFQEAAHPRGSFQAERAAAGENDRVNSSGEMRRAEQLEYFGTGGVAE